MNSISFLILGDIISASLITVASILVYTKDSEDKILAVVIILAITASLGLQDIEDNIIFMVPLALCFIVIRRDFDSGKYKTLSEIYKKEDNK